MSRLVFRSIMACDFEEFIRLKRNLGYKYATEEYVLRAFDTFLVNRGVTDPVLTKDVFDAWMARRQHEAGSTYRERCVVAVQFARYMSDVGKPCFIPRLPKTKVAGFTAHIFTEEEIGKILSACDRLTLRSLKKDSVIIMLPALIRLLYGTGIRVTEGIMLKDADVNLVENYITLRDTKSRKDRIVPITESLASVCREYKKYRNMLPVIIDKEYFFLSLAGRRCANDGVIYTWFRTILREAGIPHNCKHKGPRLHDLRHPFSVHSLARMSGRGIDLYCSLPILSTYLGHSSIQSTNNYVRLYESLYPDLIKRLDIDSLNVYPDLYEDENDRL